MRPAIIVLFLVLGLLGMSFAVENAQTVEFGYFVGRVEVALSLLLVVTLLLGAALGVIASLGMVWRLRRAARELRRSVVLAERELNASRAKP